jgi:hypothetical protein
MKSPAALETTGLSLLRAKPPNASSQHLLTMILPLMSNLKPPSLTVICNSCQLEMLPTMDGKRGVLLQGFNIIGVHGRSLVTLSFETQAEAKAAHEAMLPIVRAARVITPHIE